MEPGKALLEAWSTGSGLSYAWLVFARPINKRRYRELRSKGEHKRIQNYMERELGWRISYGEFQAFGIEHGSGAGPVAIQKYYFSKTAKIDWDKETVEAFGKKFHEVRVQGPREEADCVAPINRGLVDPKLVEWESEREVLSNEPVPSGELQVRSDFDFEPPSMGPTPPNDPEIVGRPEGKSGSAKQRGRRSVVPKVREIVSELMANDQFAGLRKGEIERLVAEKTRERFPQIFPHPSQPSRNIIYRALAEEGWLYQS